MGKKDSPGSRSFAGAVLVGAAIALVGLLFAWAMRTPDGPPRPAGPFDPADFVRARGSLDAPYVASDYAVVDAMLALAKVRPGDQVIDLGSGDGRILIAAARSHGARGLGVDIDPARVREATQNAQAAGVAHRVTFRRQNLFQTPLGEADVVTLYLTEEVNRRLRPRILAQMRPGTRVVSHDFDMGEWRPDQRQRRGTSTVYLWIVPADVGGRWTLSADGRTVALELRQSFQRLEGQVDAGNVSSRIEQGYVAGDRVHFIADIGEGRRAFEGRLVEDRLVGDGGWQARPAG